MSLQDYGLMGIILILVAQSLPKLLEKIGHGQETNVHVEAGNQSGGHDGLVVAHGVRLDQHDRDIKELKTDFHGQRIILTEINNNMIRVQTTLQALVDDKGKP